MIDSHTHIDYLNKDRSKYGYFCTAVDLLNVLWENGIDSAICSQVPSNIYIDGYEKSFKNIPYLGSNVLLLEEKNKNDKDGKIIPFLNIHPNIKLSEQISNMAHFIGSDGFKGIKYHCQLTDTEIIDIGKKEIMDMCEQFGLPILLHTGISDIWGASKILPLAKQYPKVNFCIAHLGRFQKIFWDLIDNHGFPNNLFVDVSPYYLSFKTQQTRGFKRGIDLSNSEPESFFIEFCKKYQNNILRGTDYPFVKNENHSNGNYQENVKLLDLLPIDIKDKITESNTRKFLSQGI